MKEALNNMDQYFRVLLLLEQVKQLNNYKLRMKKYLNINQSNYFKTIYNLQHY